MEFVYTTDFGTAKEADMTAEELALFKSARVRKDGQFDMRTTAGKQAAAAGEAIKVRMQTRWEAAA